MITLIRRCALLVLISLSTHSLSAQTTPSDQECIKLGEELAVHLGASDGATVVKLMDIDAFLTETLVGLGLTPVEAVEFKKSATKTLTPTLSKELSNFNKARFLRLQKVDGRTRALVRCVSESGAVNFTAFIGIKGADGKVRWSNAFSYISGETMADSTRRSVLPLIADSKKGLIAKLTSKEDLYVKNFPKVMNAIQLFQSGKPDEATKIFDALPKAVQRDRTVLIFRLRAAQPLSEEKYLKVMTDWREAFPNDATLDFISIDYAYLKKDYAAAVDHISKFNKTLGGDNYLELMLANTYLIMDRLDEAGEVGRRVYASEPELGGAFDVVAAVSLRRKDYGETVKLLKELGRRYPTADMKSIIDADSTYADFRDSSHYRDWLASLKTPTGRPE